MSNRTLVELNHDFCPQTEDGLSAWAENIQRYMFTGDKSFLPQGVTFKSMRHHSEPDLQSAWKELSDRISLILRGKPVRDFDEVRSKFMRIAGVKD